MQSHVQAIKMRMNETEEEISDTEDKVMENKEAEHAYYHDWNRKDNY